MFSVCLLFGLWLMTRAAGCVEFNYEISGMHLLAVSRNTTKYIILQNQSMFACDFVAWRTQGFGLAVML